MERFDQMAECITDRVDNPAEAGVERYVGLEHLDPESLRIRRWGLPSDVEATKLRFRPSDIIFGRRRAYQRKLAVADFEGICSAHAMVLRAREDVALKEFLPLFMQSDLFFDRALAISVGSLSPTINWRTLARQEFPLPPKDEQRRMAEILWAVERWNRSLEALRQATMNVREARINTLASQYRDRHQLVPLDLLILQGRPITYGILKPGPHYEGGIPVIKIRDYPNGFIDERGLQRVSPHIEADYKRSRLKPGDLLLSIRGTIGRLAEVPPQLEDANITQDTARLSIDPHHNRHFVRLLLESSFAQRQMRVATTGLAVTGINIGAVRKLQLPVPPRGDQDDFVAQHYPLHKALDVLDRSLDIARRSKASLVRYLLRR